MADSPTFGRYAAERLPERRTALLLVDMQNYFIDPQYPFGRQLTQVIPEASAAYFRRVRDVVLPNARQLLEAFRARGDVVAFTEFGSLDRSGADLPGWARRHNERGRESVGSPVYPPLDDPSCRIDPNLAPLADELVLRKNTSGPLNASGLDRTLRTLGIDTVVIGGLVTDVCVTQSARELGDRDFDVIVVEDACATVNETRHLSALESLATSFGFVAKTADVMKLLGRG